MNGQQAFETQLEIIDQLPDYTKLKIFTPSAQIRMKLEESLHEDTLSRVTFFDASNAPDFTVWAQDFTEGDSSVQILPLTYLGGGQRKSLNEPGNEFLFQLESSGIEIRRVPVEFGGGNVFIAKDSEGKKILLTGSDDFLHTTKSYGDAGLSLSEQSYREILQEAFNVDRVDIMGTKSPSGDWEPQHRSTFHIDQIMIPLGDGVVAMPNMPAVSPSMLSSEVEEQKRLELKSLAEQYGISSYSPSSFGNPSIRPEAEGLSQETLNQLISEENRIREKFLGMEKQIVDHKAYSEVALQVNQLRTQMESKGFSIIDLEATPTNIGNFQSYTNSIVYTDKTTGQKTVIMPIFPNEKGEYLLEGTNLANKKSFEDAGFVVKTVKDISYKQGGNIHCLTILADNSQYCPECDLSLA